MNAIILSIGDELVLGHTVDTNSAWLAQQLAAVGCEVSAHITVGDDQDSIENAILDAAPVCDFLLITGGIGPTDDDLTRQAMSSVLKAPLEPDEAWLGRIHGFFKNLGRPMPEKNSIQAMIPRGARLIENTAGTAAGIEASICVGIGEYNDVRQENACRVFVMPGVPKEMKIMFQRDVLPQVRKSGGGGAIVSRTLHTFGLGESAIAEKLGDLMSRERNPLVGTTVAQGIVSVRIYSRGNSLEEAHNLLETTEKQCHDALGDLIYGQDDETLQQVVARLLMATTGKAITVTTAESCTGGLLAKMLTDVSGSSDYFKMGWITYSNDSKFDRLGVSREIIGLYGAVSEPVVEAMAGHARRLAGADIALAVSGVAGPTGGTDAKPVGMVCIALAHADGGVKRTFHFPGDREMVRDRAAKMALTMLRYHLLGKPLPF